MEGGRGLASTQPRAMSRVALDAAGSGQWRCGGANEIEGAPVKSFYSVRALFYLSRLLSKPEGRNSQKVYGPGLQGGSHKGFASFVFLAAGFLGIWYLSDGPSGVCFGFFDCSRIV